MPLKRGSGQKIVAANIAKLRHEGRPAAQAAAIAYSVAKKAKKPTLKTLMK